MDLRLPSDKGHRMARELNHHSDGGIVQPTTDWDPAKRYGKSAQHAKVGKKRHDVCCEQTSRRQEWK